MFVAIRIKKNRNILPANPTGKVSVYSQSPGKFSESTVRIGNSDIPRSVGYRRVNVGIKGSTGTAELRI